MRENLKTNTLTIYQKSLDLLEYTYIILNKYPKSEKYALVITMKNSMFTIIRTILYANKMSKNSTERLKEINKLDVEVQLQKMYVRLSYQNKYINSNNYMEWSKRLDEIGKMIGGWLKSSYAKEKI